MKRLVVILLAVTCLFSLPGCGTKTSNSVDSEMPYLGAPKIVLNGCDYFARGLDTVTELPKGYIYAGELTDKEKEYAYINGSKYYIQEEAETINDFYVYQECGILPDNLKRQWAYVRWSRIE